MQVGGRAGIRRVFYKRQRRCSWTPAFIDADWKLGAGRVLKNVAPLQLCNGSSLPIMLTNSGCSKSHENFGIWFLQRAVSQKRISKNRPWRAEILPIWPVWFGYRVFQQNMPKASLGWAILPTLHPPFTPLPVPPPRRWRRGVFSPALRAWRRCGISGRTCP